jgi:hypothetical protein
MGKDDVIIRHILLIVVCRDRFNATTRCAFQVILLRDLLSLLLSVCASLSLNGLYKLTDGVCRLRLSSSICNVKIMEPGRMGGTI